jgi:very-short-patch-repair endonuclease
VIIANKNPDFININGKKAIIEVYGEYWHKGQNPKDRANMFKKYGYSTLVVWDNEFKDMNKVIGKIQKYYSLLDKLL